MLQTVVQYVADPYISLGVVKRKCRLPAFLAQPGPDRLRHGNVASATTTTTTWPRPGDPIAGTRPGRPPVAFRRGAVHTGQSAISRRHNTLRPTISNAPSYKTTWHDGYGNVERIPVSVPSCLPSSTHFLQFARECQTTVPMAVMTMTIGFSWSPTNSQWVSISMVRGGVVGATDVESTSDETVRVVPYVGRATRSVAPRRQSDPWRWIPTMTTVVRKV